MTVHPLTIQADARIAEAIELLGAKKSASFPSSMPQVGLWDYWM